MRILMLTSGSRGDVQPMIALALKLQSRGHQIVLGAPPNFAGWVQELGLDFVSFGSDMQALMEARADVIGNRPIRLIQTMLSLIKDEMALQFSQLLSLISDCDLVIGASIQLAAGIVTEARRVPYVFVAYVPILLPSAYHPPITLYWPHPLLNPFLWRLNDLLWDLPLLKLSNQYRQQLGLAPLKHYWDAIRKPALQLVLAAPAEMTSLPPDLGHVFQTGYLHHHPQQDLPAELEAFLAQEGPVVYVGFGSMTDPDPASTTRHLIQAARKAGVRLLISRGWAGLGEHAEIPEQVHVLGNLPHHLLFPRLAGVVHHGGAGTTSTAAWAGVPQWVVPHLMDQHYWGNQVHQLGLGPAPLSRKKLKQADLALGLRDLIEVPRYRQAAAILGQRLRQDDGTTRLCEYLEAKYSPAR